MKLKVVVVDLELSRRQKQFICAAVVTGVGISVAVAAAPRSFTAGEVLKASDLNENFSGLDARIGSIENRTVTVLDSSSDDTEVENTNGVPLIYSAAKLQLTPGTWAITASACVFNTVAADTVALK